jgi:tetratricopeptide (TPR) repeat protein
VPPTYQDITGPSRALRDAVACQGRGQLQQAERLYEVVLAADARNFEALYRLGLVRLQQGRFADAARLFRQALKVERRSVDALHHLAVAIAGSGRHQEAVRLYEKVLLVQPDHPEAHNNLAHSLQVLGRNDQAMAHYETALAIRPGYPEARNNLGAILQTLGRTAEALAHYQMALAARPTYAEAHKNLGNALDALGRHADAAAHYEKAIALRPHDIEALIGLGRAFDKLDRPEAAISQFEKVLTVDPDNVGARNNLGGVIHALGRSDEAIGHYRRALAVKPDDVEAHSKLGDALLAVGRLREANDAMERAVDLSPRKAGYYWNLANSKRFGADDRHFAAMKALPPDSLDDEERIDLHFALAKAHGDVGDHETSFRHLVEGNALMRQRVAYDEAFALGRLERMRDAFTAELMRHKGGLGDPSTVPVFIVGMPRSGTTLIEQILASHPRVFGAGELREMANLAERVRDADGTPLPEAVATMSGEQLRRLGGDYLATVRRLAPSADRITDKMPGNFALAGLIQLALPNARIIHASRDLRDTAFSCFSLLFTRGQIYSYDLAELGRYCRAHHELMEHWRAVMPGVILQVRYEQVVDDLEQQARRIVAHCGLPWDDACLAFHRTDRAVRTASASQVRQPIYRSSIGRWRPHESRLQPLLRELPAT